MNKILQLSLTACVAFALDYQFAFLSGDYRMITPAGKFSSFGQYDAKNIPGGGNFQAMFYENDIIYCWAPSFMDYIEQPHFLGQISTSAMWAYNVSSNLWQWVHGPNGTRNAQVVASPAGVFHPSNLPSARYYSSTAYDSLHKKLYLYGGDASPTEIGYLFWVFSTTLNQWAFINSGAGTGYLGSIAIHEEKKLLYMFGEYGSLWQCNLTTYTWNSTVYPSSEGNLASELGVESPANYPGYNTFPALVFHQRTGQMYLFGGDYYGEPFDSLWRYNTSSKQWALLHGSIPQYSYFGGAWTRYASRRGVPNRNDYIGRRSRCGMTIDQESGVIYIAGGWEIDMRYSAMVEFYYYSDLWSYNTTSGLFTWLAGDYEANSVAMVGFDGIPSVDNNPGGAIYPKLTVDPTTKSVYRLGGTGMCTTSNTISNCNSLWVAVDIDRIKSVSSSTSTTSSTTTRGATTGVFSSSTSTILTTNTNSAPTDISLSSTISITNAHSAVTDTSQSVFETTLSLYKKTSTTPEESTKFYEISTTFTGHHDATTAPSINNPASFILSSGNTLFMTIAVSSFAAFTCGTLSSLMVVVLYECGCCARLSKHIRNNKEKRPRSPPPVLTFPESPLNENPPFSTHIQFNDTAISQSNFPRTNYPAYTNYNGPTMITQATGELNIPGFLHIEPHEFRLENQIAKGGNSQIFQAMIFAPNLNYYSEKVVGKVFYEKDVSFMRPAVRDAFYQEIALMNMLKNQPYIAKIVAFCTSGPVVLFMKHYALGSLRNALDNRLLGRSKLMAQICLYGIAKGLQTLHRYGVAHYDVKPENVLIDQNADGSILTLLTDFGISRVFQEYILKVKAFNATVVRGLTYHYAAPEVIRAFKGTNTVSHVQQADIYALAVVAYELLAGKTAWARK